MKSLSKKLVSLLTVACICAAGAVPVSVSATIVGDVNNDGAVSLLDVTALNKYLAGQVDITDLSAADATGNYVVNFYDSTSDGTTYLRGGGVRMTTNLLHFYKNNPNIYWGS